MIKEASKILFWDKAFFLTPFYPPKILEMHHKCKKTKKFELCFKNWVLGGSLFSSNLTKKRHQSLPRKLIVSKTKSNNQNVCEKITHNVTNELNNKEIIIEHGCNSEEERKRNSIEQTDDNHLYRGGAINYEGLHNEVVEEKLSIKDSYSNENHKIKSLVSEEMIKEKYMEQENESVCEFKDGTINCENKYKKVEEERLSIRDTDDSESYNPVTSILEGIIKGKDIVQEYESDREIMDETINYENINNEGEEDNLCMGSYDNVDNCDKNIPQVEDMTKEKRIEETEEKKVENLEYCENLCEDIEKDRAGHKSSQNDDNCEENQNIVIEKKEDIGQEDCKGPDKDDLANCDNSNQEAEEDKLSDRNTQNGVNKNETSLKDIPSIENAAKEAESFSGSKANHDEAGGCGDYSTIADKIKNNVKTNYCNNNRDYRQWGDLKITIYGVVNIYTNGKKLHKQVEKKGREEIIPPIDDDLMNINDEVPHSIIHDENDKGKEKLSKNIKKKDESPSIQLETEGVRKRQQEKQKHNLQPDEVWSVDDCRILENLMVNYNANKWLHLQAQFFNWTDRMISAELIAQKFHDDCEISVSSKI